MSIKGGGKHFSVIVFLLSIISISGIIASYDAFAGSFADTGDNLHPSSGINCEIKVKSDGTYSVGGWTVDTCFGMSWVYYKWPTDDQGNPINADIHFPCTGGTCAKGRTESIVTKECGKPENGGGFWYLGFEAYSTEGKYYLNSLGYQVGKPRAGYLTKWLRTDGLEQELPSGSRPYVTGLYPVTIFGTQYINVAFQNGYSPLTSTYLDMSSEVLNGNYTPTGKLQGPGKCSDYKLSDAKCTKDASSGGWFVHHWPYIIVNGVRKPVEGEYYGTTKDVKADWDELTEDQVVTSAEDGSPMSNSDFIYINYFCTGRAGNLTGRSGVQVNSGSAKYSKWTNEDNPATVVADSTVEVSDSVNITFYHQIKGKGQVQATIKVDQDSLKTKDINNKENWKDRTWNYTNDANNTEKTATRTRTVTRAELEAISSGTTKVCDTMTFGAQSSTACVNLAPVSPIDEVTTKSAVKIPKEVSNNEIQSSGYSEATKTSPNGEVKTVDYDVTVIGSPASIEIQFDHSISALSRSGKGTANVSYKIVQSTNNESATVTKYNDKTGTAKVEVGAANVLQTVTADSPTITVSNIKDSTDIKVCQKMTATYEVTMTTTVCAHIRGNKFTVNGQSSVVSGKSSATTNWQNDGKPAITSRTIYKPYNGTASTTAYFTHDLRAQNSDSVVADTGNITYSIKRGDDYIQGYKNKTYSFNTSNGDHNVYAASVDVPIGTTCQTLEFSYGTDSGTPTACIKIVGESPTFTGESEVSAGSKKASTSTNNDAADLGVIKLRIAADGTGKQTVSFKHKITATSTHEDANGKSTGVMPFTVEKSYTSNYEGSFVKTFPSSGSTTASGDVSTGPTDVYVVPGETKTVCETLKFSGWKTTACATVVGELSLPTVESQTTAKHKNTSRSSGWATKSSSNKTADSFEIVVPMLPSVSANGGIDVPVTFIHDVKAIITSELDIQNTGNVPYTITTSGATDNTIENDKKFRIEVKNTPIGNERTKIETITRDKIANVRIDQTTTVCQTLSFTYDGVTRSTTACANFRGISADPKGASKVTVKGCGNGVSASTGYVDGAIVWLDVDGCSEDNIKGSDIVFDHSFSIGGEMSVDIPFSTTNSCSDSNSCEKNYSKTYNSSSNRPLYQYEGHSGTARTVVWLYRKVLSDGTITNTYERNPAITNNDAKNMYKIGAACETLSFEYDGTWHNTTACVRFRKYNTCPNLGTIGTTISTSYVKKYLGSSTTSPTPDQTSVIYAKPTDNIEFLHCYYPGAQATRYTNDVESKYANPSNNGKYVNIPLRNAFVEQQNQFTISNKAGTDSFVGNNNNYDYALGGQIMQPSGSNTFIGIIGNPAATSVTSSKTQISTNAVGYEIEQSLLDHPGTNSVAGHNQGNCGSGCVVYYQNSDDNKWYDITKRNSDSAISESSSAKVIVPYNYRTIASIGTKSDYVYAGESISGQNVKVLVNQRYNAMADDTYATKTAESTVRLYMFYTSNTNPNEGGDHQRAGSNINACTYYGNTLGFSNCAELPTKNGASTSGLVFNENSNTNPDPNKPESVSAFMPNYNVPDLPAGSKVCMGVTVYPAESTDTEPSNGNTFVSKAYCQTVAKKPSFQVWGGSVYASGDIAANLATKYTIDGVYSYNMVRASGAPSITFGSWVEQAIMANGVVTGLASGAATGYGNVGLVVNAENPGGSKSNKYCDMSRLSLANTLCQSNKTGRFGISGESATKTTLKEKYASKAKAKDVSRNDDKNTYVSLNLSNAGSYTEEDGVRYTFAESNLAIEATGRLAAGTMHVVYAKGNIVIRGSSLLYNDGTLQSLNDVPQYIIIADGNIYIEPSVTRVDAVLLAEKTINTCAKLSGNSITEASKAGNNLITDLYCNKQLKINGTLIADALKLYRIFGASTGLNSVVPAEIINYSPSLYLWESSRVEEKHTRSLYTTYLHELAPRQ